MEGVIDAPMRALMAEIGGFDFAVSEFVRVSQEVIHAATFLRRLPELAGTRLGRAVLPLQVQLLGADPERMAATAVEACLAGGRAIDLNFGCPSPTVTRHQGGSALLRDPERIHRIVYQVRRALPAAVPVSAKIRLGWESPAEVHAIARAVCDGGADWLVIHARTRAEGYRPGVHWDLVGQVTQASPIPVIANGDIFSVEDLKQCQQLTRARHFMIGRGILLNPHLQRQLSGELGLSRQASLLRDPDPSCHSTRLIVAILRLIDLSEPLARNCGYIPSRIKQWVRMARGIRPDLVSRPLLSAVCKARTADELRELLDLSALSAGHSG